MDNAAGGMGAQKGTKKSKHPGRAAVDAAASYRVNLGSYSGKDFGMGMIDKSGKGGAIDS